MQSRATTRASAKQGEESSPTSRAGDTRSPSNSVTEPEPTGVSYDDLARATQISVEQWRCLVDPTRWRENFNPEEAPVVILQTSFARTMVEAIWIKQEGEMLLESYKSDFAGNMNSSHKSIVYCKRRCSASCKREGSHPLRDARLQISLPTWQTQTTRRVTRRQCICQIIHDFNHLPSYNPPLRKGNQWLKTGNHRAKKDSRGSYELRQRIFSKNMHRTTSHTRDQLGSSKRYQVPKSRKDLTCTRYTIVH
jgi:hypothetical protein